MGRFDCTLYLHRYCLTTGKFWSVLIRLLGVWVWSLTHVHLYFLHLVFAQWHKFPWSKSIKIYTQIQGLKGRPSSILDFILFFCLYLCPCWYELEEGTWCMTNVVVKYIYKIWNSWFLYILERTFVDTKQFIIELIWYKFNSSHQMSRY